MTLRAKPVGAYAPGRATVAGQTEDDRSHNDILVLQVGVVREIWVLNQKIVVHQLPHKWFM